MDTSLNHDPSLETPQDPAPSSWRPATAYAELLRDLVREAQHAQLTNIDITYAGFSVRLRRAPTLLPAHAQGPAAMTSATSASDIVAARRTHWTPLVAPLAGVFYTSPSPDAPPFAPVGERVTVGQVVGLIESMKMFNEVVAEVSGVVRDVIVVNGDIVQAGQHLLYLDVADQGGADAADLDTNEPATLIGDSDT